MLSSTITEGLSSAPQPRLATTNKIDPHGGGEGGGEGGGSEDDKEHLEA